MGRICKYLSINSILKHFKLRVHKFRFQWRLAFHLFVGLMGLMIFALSGDRRYAVIPLGIWTFYNVMFFIGTGRTKQVLPGFSDIKQVFHNSIEEFVSPK